MGMIRRRKASFGAWRDTARVMGMPSLARSYILGTMPDVDRVMLR